jgi:C4-dicarboxylate transporter, DctM subunit
MLLLGLWVGFSLLAVGLVAMELATTAPAGMVFGTKVWGALNVWDLTALPMFIWMGEILFRSRLSSNMFAGLAPFTRRLPGRLLARQYLRLRAVRGGLRLVGGDHGNRGRMSLPELKRAATTRMASSAPWPGREPSAS